MKNIFASYVFPIAELGEEFIDFLKADYPGQNIIICLPASKESLDSLNSAERTRLEKANPINNNVLLFGTEKYVLTGSIDSKGTGKGGQSLKDPGRID